MPKFVLINGSLHGASKDSNTLALLHMAEAELKNKAVTVLISPERVTYNSKHVKSRNEIYVLPVEKTIAELKKADGIIVGTGNHWGQTSSVLQKFLEDATDSAGKAAWFNKPVGIFVSEHSTGGQTVLANLMVTLSCFGCVIPPQSQIVLSRAGLEAKKHGGKWAEDIWGPDDVKTICKNLLAYACAKPATKIQPWPLDEDSKSYNARWVGTKKRTVRR